MCARNACELCDSMLEARYKAPSGFSVSSQTLVANALSSIGFRPTQVIECLSSPFFQNDSTLPKSRSTKAINSTVEPTFNPTDIGINGDHEHYGRKPSGVPAI